MSDTVQITLTRDNVDDLCFCIKHALKDAVCTTERGWLRDWLDESIDNFNELLEMLNNAKESR